jgi:hypothetical protein
MTMPSRVGKTLIVIGVSLIIVSLFAWTSYGESVDVSHGDYEGIMVKTSGSFYVEINTRDRNFSLFLMTYDEVTAAMRVDTFENASMLLEEHNIASFSGLIHILIPGWYALLVTPQENETISFDIQITKSMPREGFFVPGVFLIGMGTLVQLESILKWTRTKMKHS